MLTAVFVLLGTLIGAFISMITQFLVAKRNQVNQFRLASIDKRLSTHQDGYKLVNKLFKNIYTDGKERNEINKECEDWWCKNCLYLCLKSFEALDKLLYAYSMHDPNNRKAYSNEHPLNKQFKTTIEILRIEVYLPSVSEDINWLFTNKSIQ